MKASLQILKTYFYYLIHPFKSHRLLKEAAARGEEGEILSLSLYESLGASWMFIVIGAMARIILLNGVILLFLNMLDPASGLLSKFYDGDKFTGFYFLVLSAVLDVVFFPLVTLFIVQFWEFVLKTFAKMAGLGENADEKARTVLSVALSSHVLQVIPVFGDMAQKLALFVQMYAGAREQLGFSRSLTLCALFTPVLLLLFFLSLIVLLSAL